MPPVKHRKMRQSVIDACLAMNTQGLNQGTAGNVSVRNGDGFLVTASGIDYTVMQPEHVVQMALDGSWTGQWKPSSEWRMHRDIYANRAEAGAVVHAHSAYATALACLRKDVPAFHYMIAVAGGDSLRCADYATFGTEGLSQAMMTALEDRRACLLANHGQICFGPTVTDALKLAVEVEVLCKQYLLATLAGAPVLLGEDEMAEVLIRFQSYGKQDQDVPGP